MGNGNRRPGGGKRSFHATPLSIRLSRTALLRAGTRGSYHDPISRGARGRLVTDVDQRYRYHTIEDQPIKHLLVRERFSRMLCPRAPHVRKSTVEFTSARAFSVLLLRVLLTAPPCAGLGNVGLACLYFLRGSLLSTCARSEIALLVGRLRVQAKISS